MPTEWCNVDCLHRLPLILVDNFLLMYSMVIVLYWLKNFSFSVIRVVHIVCCCTLPIQKTNTFAFFGQVYSTNTVGATGKFHQYIGARRIKNCSTNILLEFHQLYN